MLGAYILLEMPEQRVKTAKVILQILPKIGCYGNVPKGIKKEVRIENIHTNLHLVKRS